MAEDFVSLESEVSLENQGNPAQPTKEPIKHLLVGSPQAVKTAIHTLHVKGYAEAGLWSKTAPAGELGRAGEVVSILIKQLL